MRVQVWPEGGGPGGKEDSEEQGTEVVSNSEVLRESPCPFPQLLALQP